MIEFAPELVKIETRDQQDGTIVLEMAYGRFKMSGTAAKEDWEDFLRLHAITLDQSGKFTFVSKNMDEVRNVSGDVLALELAEWFPRHRTSIFQPKLVPSRYLDAGVIMWAFLAGGGIFTIIFGFFGRLFK